MLARVSAERASARRLVPARLDGWRRVVLRGTPYPTLIADTDEAVDGAVLRVGAGVLARLSAYEGRDYVLTPVTVTTGRGPRRVRAWIAPAWRADAAHGWP